MSGPRRRRLLEILRRAAQPEVDASGEVDPESIDAALWSSHHEAARAVGEASEAAPQIADTVGQHRAMINGASERASAMAAHAEGLTLAATRVGDAFERLSVVALNAGLEGARTVEPQGKALLLLSEEIRAHAGRGAETARDLVAVVEEIAAETSVLRKELADALEAAEETGKEARALVATLGRAGGALAEVDRYLRRATGIDPEVSRAVALAAEHARGLFGALSTLRAAAQARPVLLRALRPVLSPLARLLGELGEPVRPEESSRPSSPPGGEDGSRS
jgi:methyl-accepting chemotaxis protein